MRTSFLLPLLAISAPVLAWDHVVVGPTLTPSSVHAMLTAPMGERDVVVALGESESWIVDPLHGEVVRTLDRGGRDAILFDVDGDGRLELVGCGADGIWSVPWTGRYGGVSTSLSGDACEAIVAVTEGPYKGLIAGGEGWVAHYAIDAGTAVRASVPPFQAEPGAPLFAAHGGLVAYAVVGGEHVSERGAAGLSSFATGGPIGDLAWSRRGWTWTLPDSFAVADMSHQSTPLPDARKLVPVGDDLLVLGEGVSTWLVGSGVEAFSTPSGVLYAAHGDIDGDGCADLVLGNAEGVTTLNAVCTDSADDGSADEEPVEDTVPRLAEARRVRQRTVLGVEVPSFLGDAMVTASERERGQRYVVVGSGWAMGRTLGAVEVQIPFFPALALGYEVGGPHVRAFFGIDSAALFFWIRPNGTGGIHLLNATAGVTVGSPRLRAGPFITGGIFNYGAGVRTVLTPWLSSGSYKGLEARLTVFGPSTGEVMVLYVWSQRVRRRTQAADAAPAPPKQDEADEYPELARVRVKGEPRGRSKLPICGTFRVGAGAATSVSSTRYSWSFVGNDSQVAFGGSPALAFACESGGSGVGLLLGMESAPFLRYLGPADAKLHQYGTLTTGLDVGSQRFRVGVIGTAGIWELGGGVRTVVGLHKDRQGLQHHLELRALGLYRGAPAAEAMLLYGFSWDPWKAPEFRDE